MECAGSGRGDCCEWSDISGIPASIAGRFREVAMPGVEGVPNGIGEEIFRLVAHC